ncbi:MAG: hypothetical protein KGI51_13210, partial [Rhodospirillales bacterium]|nr:hypothetical protein [Rhodospirillales bacterium]
LRLRGTDAAPFAGATEASLLARAIAVLDPLAPLAWQGIALWPDGMGGALAEAAADRSETGATRLRALGTLIEAEEVAPWGELRAPRDEPASRRADARLWRGWLSLSGPAGGMKRLTYELNPLLPSASPVLGGRIVTGLAVLPAALEAAAPQTGEAGPLDADLLAFIAARQEHRGAKPPEGFGAIQQMEILARLQARYHPAPLPALSRWLARAAAPLAAQWHHRARREAIGRDLAARAEAGMIAPMLALLRDPAEHEADARGLAQARAERARLDAELAALAAGGEGRAALARRWGPELAAGFGIAALAAVLGLAALG